MTHWHRLGAAADAMPLLAHARTSSLSDPYAAAHVAVARALGDERAEAALIAHWHGRSAGSPKSPMRYRWELSHRRGAPMPPWAPDAAMWRAWRAAEQPQVAKDPFAFEERLTLPIVIAENAELLLDAAAGGSAVAATLFSEAAPILRRDLAGFVQGNDPWADTFALYCLVKRERALEALHPLAVAIAEVQAAGCAGGPVRGQRFPFHDLPLCSASAQLAVGALTLGTDLELVAVLCRYVESCRMPDGGFADAGGSSDVFTSLVASDLLVRLNPVFDPGPTLESIRKQVRADGLHCALGPEAIWLSAEITELCELARFPFARRFRWPHVPRVNRDKKTGLPFYSYFADVAQLFAAIPGLAGETVEVGFIDLIGFRAFNNRFGQQRGDEVLAELAQSLLELEGIGSVRDGGDEFLLVAPPGQGGLATTIELFRRNWVSRFSRRFGSDALPVLPRIVVTRTPGRALAAAREDLGRRITELKSMTPGALGILVSVD